jgi:protein TonB
MFGKLLESRAERVQNRGGAIASAVGHAVLITLAVMATRSTLVARGTEEHIVALPVLHPAPSAPPEKSPVTGPATTAPGIPPRPTTVVPIIILPGIPPIDLTATTPTELSWRSDSSSRRSASGSRSSGAGDDGIPFAPDVDKPAIALAGNPAPRYPEILRRAQVRGEVVVQVVIDTTGRADMTTVRVMSSDHQLLTDAVLDALPRARYLSAEVGGKKVRMWAVQSFVFEIDRE